MGMNDTIKAISDPCLLYTSRLHLLRQLLSGEIVELTL